MRDDRPRRRDAWALAGRRRRLMCLCCSMVFTELVEAVVGCGHLLPGLRGQGAGLEPHTAVPRCINDACVNCAVARPPHQGATGHHPRGSGLSAKRHKTHTHTALPPSPACLPAPVATCRTLRTRARSTTMRCTARPRAWRSRRGRTRRRGSRTSSRGSGRSRRATAACRRSVSSSLACTRTRV